MILILNVLDVLFFLSVFIHQEFGVFSHYMFSRFIMVPLKVFII
jgi:hypothetical protein